MSLFTNFLLLGLNFFPQKNQLLFQHPATTMMEGIIDLHHDIFSFLVIIIVFVSLMLVSILVDGVRVKRPVVFMKFHSGVGITHHTLLETIWTAVPTIILLFISIPSFALIYALDEIVEPQVTVRVVGRQWYWTYEFPDPVGFEVDQVGQGAQAWVFGREFSQIVGDYLFAEFLARPGITGSSDFEHLSFQLTNFKIPSGIPFINEGDVNSSENALAIFLAETYAGHDLAAGWALVVPGFTYDSYIVDTDDLPLGSFRLLEVNRRLVLPVQTNVRLLVTSYDVLHSWAVPSFGVKVDAVPGRLNEYFINVEYLGVFFGQCSEICGVNHGFMPIKVEIVSLDEFRLWFLLTSLVENKPIAFLHSAERLSAPSEVFYHILAGDGKSAEDQ
jgi:heme/copper-type cytochrome/quinol oxidase subunit 2